MRFRSLSFCFALPLSLAACGGDDASTTPHDAGPECACTVHPPNDAAPPPVDAGPDAQDANIDGGGDAGPAPLVPASDAFFGLTADGYAVYGASGMLRAVSVKGGAPIDLETNLGSNASVYVTGKAVFVLGVHGTGSIDLWTKAHGVVALTQAHDPSTPVPMASPDGASVSWWEGASPSTLVVAAPDGTGKKTLATTTCASPSARFSALGDLFLETCAASGGASQVSRYAAGTWVKTDLLAANTVAQDWRIDPTGAVFARDVVGSGTPSAGPGWELVNVQSGKVTALSPSSDAMDAVFDAPAASFLYRASAGLESWSVASGGATLLAANGCDSILELSGDGSMVLCEKLPAGLAVASVKTPAAVVDLAASTSGRSSVGSFTADAKFVLYFRLGGGELSSLPVDGGAAIVLTTNATQLVGTLPGSEVVVVETLPSGGTYALHVRDPAGHADRVLASDVQTGSVLTTDKAFVVYVRTGDGAIVAVPTR